MHLFTFVILVLLTGALSKSNEEEHESTRRELHSSSSVRKIRGATRNEQTEETYEMSDDRTTTKVRKRQRDVTEFPRTPLIPEDPNLYKGIVDYVRELSSDKASNGRIFDEKSQSNTTERNRVKENSRGHEVVRNPPQKLSVANEREIPVEETTREKNATVNDKELSLESSRNSQDKFSRDKGVFRETSMAKTSEVLGKYSLRGIIPPGEEEVVEEDHNATTNVEIERTNRTESRANGENFEPDEEDLEEAATYGLQSMHDLYYIKEPKLYSMGLYLETDNPARYVAAFNDQTEEAKILSKYGFAVLEGTTMFRKKFPDASVGLILSRQRRRNPLQRNCPDRGTPECPKASLRYRTSDGSCNNLQHLWWGSAMSPMQRFLPAVYQDGIQSLRRSKTGRPLPSPREISSIIHEDKDVPLASVTHMLMQWGQFVDHDLTATGQSRGFNGTVPQCCLNAGAGFQPPEFMHPECLPISVSEQDTFYGPLGVRCLEFLRSGSAPREDCEFGPREQLTQVTSYLDASTVYSSNAFQSDSLRLFRNGLLQYGRIQSRRPLLPKRETDLCKRGSLSTTCFRAGDGRLSEQPALTSLHVVFLRLHNRIATKLAAVNFHWNDERLFQESRKIVGAIVQHITYREFLPIILGQEVMKIFDLEILKKGYYDGYDSTVNPTIANGFSTAAFRFGHSLVQRSFVRYDGQHEPIFNNVSIHDEFSNPVNLETAGSVDRLLLGLMNQPSQRRDEFITEELTNHLFQTPRFPFGMDLASLNIQRGRDHGIPPYVKWREPCGLSSIRSFDDLNRVMPATAVRKFRFLYDSVEDIDLFPAGLAENSVAGGLVGPTFACIIAQQFNNLRRGDRFWYENPEKENGFTLGQLQQIRRMSLAQVLCRTMDNIETIQPFVFLTHDTMKNGRVLCKDPSIGQFNFEFWAEASTEQRSNVNYEEKSNRRTYGDQTNNAKPGTKEHLRIGANGKEESKLLTNRQKPVKAGIHQQNKIVVKRPIGPPDNVTIVVQNNAVNSPVFVNDAIYGSHVKIQPSALFQAQSTQNPIFNVDHKPTYQDSPPVIINFPTYNPAKPIPTSIPFSTALKTYVPHAYGDPNNPNPMNHGFQTFNPPSSDVVFDSFPASTPRPTLYTYYTNLHQKPATQRPQQHHANDHLPNYTVQDHKQQSEQFYVTPKPTTNPWLSHGPNYGLRDQSTYKPIYGTVGNSQLYNDDGTKPDNWHQLQHQYRPGSNQQSDPGNWNTPNYSNRPNDRPAIGQHTVTSGQWNSQNYHDKPYDQQDTYQQRPTKRPYDHDNLAFYETKPNTRPSNQDDYIATWSSEPSYQTGTIKEPNSQYNVGNGEFYQTRPNKRPVQADPDGWTTIPSYQNESGGKPHVYQDAGTWTNVPAYQSQSAERPTHSTSSDSFLSYQKRPSHQDKFADTPSSYQSEPVSSFPVQTSWSDVPSYTKNPTKPLMHQSDFGQSPNYEKPTGQTFGVNHDNEYYGQSDHEDLKNSPSYESAVKPLQNDNRINIHTYTLGAIKKPISIVEHKYDDEQITTKPPKNGGLNDLIDNLNYQSSARPELQNSGSSVADHQSYKVQNNFNSKPNKVHSVTIVNDGIETVGQSGYSAERIESKITNEVPKPLVSQTKETKTNNRKTGQYYYEKNVLHRYPDKVDDQSTGQNYHLTEKSNNGAEQRHNKLSSESAPKSENSTIGLVNSNTSKSLSDVSHRDDENKMTYTTIESSNTANRDGDVYDDLEGAFSEEVESTATPERENHWLNSEEDTGLPSVLDIPRISIEGNATARELPRPIKFRNHAS